jgi:hypothetical protein
MTEKQIYNQFKKQWKETSSFFISEFKDWYVDMQKWIDENRPEKYTLVQACAIFSCLSVMKSVEENKKLFLSFSKGSKSGHFKKQINKCVLISKKKDLRPKEANKIIRGNKTVSFFNNLYNPNNPRYVCNDRHIIKLSYKGENKNITPKRYEIISRAIKKLSKEVNLIPNQTQAVLWGISKKLYGNIV